MSDRTRKRSRHNEGRKPFYKEHRFVSDPFRGEFPIISGTDIEQIKQRFRDGYSEREVTEEFDLERKHLRRMLYDCGYYDPANMEARRLKWSARSHAMHADPNMRAHLSAKQRAKWARIHNSLGIINGAPAPGIKPNGTAEILLAAPAPNWTQISWYWSGQELANLQVLAAARSPLKEVSRVLGRTEKAVAYRARELGISLPAEWSRLLRPGKLRQNEPLLCYPYVKTVKPDNADLLRANDLVPKRLPALMRADVCQSMMLALYEGTVTLEELEANKSSVQWFIKQFYKDQVPWQEVLGLSHEDDDERPYYDVADAKEEWRKHELNEARLAWDTWRDHDEATQLNTIYEYEINAAMASAWADGSHIERSEVTELLDAGTWDFRAGAYAIRGKEHHAMIRAAERYGIALTIDDLKEITAVCAASPPAYSDERADIYHVRVRGIHLSVVVAPVSKRVITVLPRMDRRKQTSLLPIAKISKGKYEYRKKYHRFAGPR